MSGYLHRLVGQVKAPASGIRPLVGSVYASPAASEFHAVREEIAAPLPLREDTRPASAVVRSETRASASSDGLFPQSERGVQPMGAEPDFRSEGARVMPFMPQANSMDRAAEFAVPAEASQHEPAMRTDDLSLNAEVTQDKVIRAAETSTQRLMQQITQPLMPRQMRTANFPAMPVAVAPAPTPADEIHINIGRIEVTAVQQAAAPRPAPRAPRRSFSLDEYLRKSDGRAQ